LLLRSASLPYVPLRVGGYEVDLLLDSGSDEFLTLPDQVAKPRRGRLVETGKARAIGGDVFTHQVRLDAKLDFAGHALVDPIVEVVQGREGTVGTALLRHFRIAIDQRHGCVTFSRACVEAVRSPPLRGMGIGLLRDGTHWTVAYLLEGTPGVAAGMQVGDEVVAIGGVAVGELSKGQYEQLLVEQDVLRLRVCAGSEVREVDVPVAVLVP
jgi:predicted aspartyl protease